MRRTPELTAKIRKVWADYLLETGNRLPAWSGAYDEIGVTRQQVRDAIWGVSADKWRQGVYAEAAKKWEHPSPQRKDS